MSATSSRSRLSSPARDAAWSRKQLERVSLEKPHQACRTDAAAHFVRLRMLAGQALEQNMNALEIDTLHPRQGAAARRQTPSAVLLDWDRRFGASPHCRVAQAGQRASSTRRSVAQDQVSRSHEQNHPTKSRCGSRRKSRCGDQPRRMPTAESKSVNIRGTEGTNEERRPLGVRRIRRARCRAEGGRAGRARTTHRRARSASVVPERSTGTFKSSSSSVVAERRHGFGPTRWVGEIFPAGAEQARDPASGGPGRCGRRRA